jgi:DNA-binding response OmpR family regulator
MKQRILIVEDDAGLATVLSDNLAFEGFQVQAVADGNLALQAARSFAPDLVILDIMLPGKSGLELCRVWREGPRIPVILLTARADRKDKLAGLKLGADDYVTKPFDLEELIARVHAVLRRARPPVQNLKLGPVTIDFGSLRAWKGPASIDLSYREFELLRYLAERSEGVVHRDELLHEVWGYADATHTRAVDHAIARLRRKLESDPHHPRFIHTVHGDGYTLTSTDAVPLDAPAASGRPRPA